MIRRRTVLLHWRGDGHNLLKTAFCSALQKTFCLFPQSFTAETAFSSPFSRAVFIRRRLPPPQGGKAGLLSLEKGAAALLQA